MASERKSGVLLLLIAATLWSSGGLLIKLIDWNPVAIAGTRSALALPVILLFLGRPPRSFSKLQIGAAFAYVGTVLLFVCATRLTTAANAIVLQYTAPIYVALLAPRLLKEPAHRSDWLLMAAALAGIGLFFVEKISLQGAAGIACALVSGVTYAATALLLRKDKSGSPLSAIFLGNLLTALAAVPFLSPPWPNAQNWMILTALGVLQLGLGYVAYAKGLQRIPAMEASLLALLEPILNPVWVLLALGEKPGFWPCIGGGIVLAAVALRLVWGNRIQSSPRAGSTGPQ
jgi:drug/metabolite transporter (DMT)-like permease